MMLPRFHMPRHFALCVAYLFAVLIVVATLPLRICAADADATVDNGADAAATAGAVAAATAGADRADPLDAGTVIVLSWDGLRHDYPNRGNFPGLTRLVTHGAHGKLRAGWPSSTFPGHVSLATGTWADRHGIVDNQFHDRIRGDGAHYAYAADANWIEAEPLWIAAERQHVKAATFFWVGSETDWHGQRSSYRFTPFDGSVPETVKVDQILDWLDRDGPHRPRLIMSYWRGADAVGHRKGPDHPDIALTIAEQDAQLTRLLDGIDARGLWPTTTLLLVSDHGMTAADESFDLDGWLAANGFAGHSDGGNAIRHVFLDDTTRRDALIAALAGQPHLRAIRGDALPPELRLNFPTRMGDVVVFAEPPLQLGAGPWYEAAARTAMRWCCDWHAGAHGYDPDLADMAAFVAAIGHGVPSGADLGTIKQIDIAPTVAALLGIAPPLQSEGAVITALVSAGASSEQTNRAADAVNGP